MKYQVLANKSLWVEDLKCYFNLCQVSGTDSVVYQKSLTVSEQNCNVYWSKVWMKLTPKLMCAIYRTAIPISIYMAMEQLYFQQPTKLFAQHVIICYCYWSHLALNPQTHWVSSSHLKAGLRLYGNCLNRWALWEEQGQASHHWRWLCSAWLSHQQE